MFRQDGHLPDNQRQLPVLLIRKGKLDAPFGELFDLVDAAVVVAIERLALGGQGFERPDDVIGANRHTVVPTGFGPHVEDHPRAVVRNFHGFRNESVLGKRLIVAGRKQGFNRTRTGGVSFGYELMKTVKRPARGSSQGTAFRRIGIDIVKMLEIRAIFWFTVHGYGMHRVYRLRKCL